MIERAVECKATYCSVLLADNLTECILYEVEWRCLGALKELLEQFDTLTTKICARKSYVTITMTVVVYNRLMGIIENFIKNHEDRLPDICQGAGAAYAKLGQYYAATDKSPIYSVATAIHPAMRFQYWSDQRWGAKYGNNAKKAVRTLWRDQYVVNTSMDLTEPSVNADDNDMELTLLELTKRPKGDQLEEFVSSGTVMAAPLGYWKENYRGFLTIGKNGERLSRYSSNVSLVGAMLLKSSSPPALYKKSPWSRQDPGANASGLLVRLFQSQKKIVEHICSIRNKIECKTIYSKKECRTVESNINRTRRTEVESNESQIE
jgi:hypothetical protein